MLTLAVAMTAFGVALIAAAARDVGRYLLAKRRLRRDLTRDERP